eukprot:jgi/Tetstr1/450239/TSEL_037277.t1
MPADHDSSVAPLRLKGFKHLPLHNAKEATGTLVRWLQVKADVSSKPGFDELWTIDTSPQHHATFMSILNQIVLDKQARTELLRFTVSTDPVITEDLTDYEKRLNMVRMELECMDKAPDESTLVVAFIKDLRDEFRTAAQMLPTEAVTATTLDAAVQHARDSMLTVDPEPADQPTSTFAADGSSNVAVESNSAILSTLKMLSTNMESMVSQAAARQRSYDVEMADFQQQAELRVVAMPINNRVSRYRILYVEDAASPNDNDTFSTADLDAYQPRIDLTHVALDRINNTHCKQRIRGFLKTSCPSPARISSNFRMSI